MPEPARENGSERKKAKSAGCRNEGNRNDGTRRRRARRRGVRPHYKGGGPAPCRTTGARKPPALRRRSADASRDFCAARASKARERRSGPPPWPNRPEIRKRRNSTARTNAGYLPPQFRRSPASAGPPSRRPARQKYAQRRSHLPEISSGKIRTNPRKEQVRRRISAVVRPDFTRIALSLRRIANGPMGKRLLHTLLGILLLAGGTVLSGNKAAAGGPYVRTELRIPAEEDREAATVRETCGAPRCGLAAAAETVPPPSRIRTLPGFRNPLLPALRPGIAPRNAASGHFRGKRGNGTGPAPKPPRYYIYTLERIRI